jgi:hypothetical protein
VDPAVLIALVAALFGAGGIGVFATLRKAGKETESIAIQSLIAVNEELRRELVRRDSEIASLRERVAKLETLVNGA